MFCDVHTMYLGQCFHENYLNLYLFIATFLHFSIILYTSRYLGRLIYL
jgi:hypothetical protein